MSNTKKTINFELDEKVMKDIEDYFYGREYSKNVDFFAGLFVNSIMSAKTDSVDVIVADHTVYENKDAVAYRNSLLEKDLYSEEERLAELPEKIVDVCKYSQNTTEFISNLNQLGIELKSRVKDRKVVSLRFFDKYDFFNSYNGSKLCAKYCTKARLFSKFPDLEALMVKKGGSLLF